ncbi:hypothetical protein F5I97DRAFT_1932474 [Phlebopus sp. FC_14]|nr:hypothetical protein F5I97DRAFT_1932474 [Phlebopus sp. FC_14]
MSQDQRRRSLSVRRGSVSAPDPTGKHATLNHDPNRSASSRLTIVRVVDSTPTSVPVTSTHTSEPPPSPILHQRRSLRRPSTSPTGDHRLSFALSSFVATTPQTALGPQDSTPRPGSSPSSPHFRPSSPSQFTRRLSSSGSSAYSRPNLSPDQLVDLARQSTSPRFVQHSPGAPSTSPVVSPISPSTFGAEAPSAVFTPLPPDVLLPFINRPAEVTILLSTPPTTKLFSLLAQTFQIRTDGEEDRNQFAADPSAWSFHTLRRWLTAVDRSMASDDLWVKNARKCVMAHSELIWERLKGALGVPPELELENTNFCLSNAETLDVDKGDIFSSTFEDPPDVAAPRAFVAHTIPQTLTIEAIIATPLPSALIQTASVSQVEQGLQDIVEGEEEEEEEDGNGDTRERSNPQEEQSQIHGLRVSTSPVLSSPPISPQVYPHPPAPIVSSAQSARDSQGYRSLETCFLSPPPRPLSGTSSPGSLSNIGRPASGSYPYRDSTRDPAPPDGGDSESDYACGSLGDRVSGNPLFPSNFARLTARPMLRPKH